MPVILLAALLGALFGLARQPERPAAVSAEPSTAALDGLVRSLQPTRMR